MPLTAMISLTALAVAKESCCYLSKATAAIVHTHSDLYLGRLCSLSVPFVSWTDFLSFVSGWLLHGTFSAVSPAQNFLSPSSPEILGPLLSEHCRPLYWEFHPTFLKQQESI